MAGAVWTDIQRTTAERYRAPCGIEVITYVGNIIGIQNATAVVTGEGVGFKHRSKITKALIESNCCPDFERVREKVIKKNKGLKAWKVRTSKLDFESKFKFIFHVLMKTQENEHWIERMKKMYERLFKKMEKYKVSILALPLLGSERAGADISDAARAVIESIALLRGHDHRHLRKIYLVTMDTQYADTMATYCQLYFQNASPHRRASVRYRMGFGGPKYRANTQYTDGEATYFQNDSQTKPQRRATVRYRMGFERQKGEASKSPAPVKRSDSFPRSGRERQQRETTFTDQSIFRAVDCQSQSTLNEPVHVQQSRDRQKTFQHDKKHLEEKQQQYHNTQFQYRERSHRQPQPSPNENSFQQPKISGNKDWHDRTGDFHPPLVLGAISGKTLNSFDQDFVDPPDVPPTWSGSSKDTELVTLLPESSEFQEVQHSFLRSIGSQTYNVIQIKRVQSTIQWNHFILSLEQMAQRNPDMSCERLLWHGTSEKSIIPICKEGFNRSFSGKNAARYGEGTYFSPNSSYAAEDTYSVPDDDGIKYVFRARVLTGRYTKGQSGMKVPPYLNEKDSTRFDSVVDNVDKPNLFVIFHDHKAYPEYLIKFS